LIYLDTSALLKLIFHEAGSDALVEYLPPGATHVSSTLLLVEARRGIARRAPGRLPELDVMLARIKLVGISDAVIEAAGRLPDPMLRSLDAIHLATALLIREDVDVLISYDDRRE
jgi:predicted nucleic acid-binding protein